jgi:integrase
MAIDLVFKHAIKNEWLEINPCATLKAPKAKARTRTLTGPEIQRVWRAAGTLASPAGAYVRFLLATGTRRNEALEARWSEIRIAATATEIDRWDIPPERMKAKREFTVPLTGAAKGALPPRGNSDFIFAAADSDRPIGGLSRVKTALDAAGEADGAGPLVAWTFHDFRRSFATWLADNRVNFAVIDLVLHTPCRSAKPGRSTSVVTSSPSAAKRLSFGARFSTLEQRPRRRRFGL